MRTPKKVVACGVPRLDATERPYRVRDKLTRARYYFESKNEANEFVDCVSTSEVTGEPLRQWSDRLVVERNK